MEQPETTPQPAPRMPAQARRTSMSPVLCLALAAASCGDDSGPPTHSSQSSSGSSSTSSSGVIATGGSSGDTARPGREPEGSPPQIDCGEPEFPAGTPLRRHPYLQSIENTSARVAWTSTRGGEGLVRFAPSPEGPWTEVPASSRMFETTYTYDTEDYTAFDSRLTELSPNTTYCYEVIEDGDVLARGLRLHTAWSGEDQRVRVLAFGDSGTLSPQQFALRDTMLERNYDLFLHLGDMAYGEGTFPELEAKFFDVYRGLLHEVPSYPTPGNHEYKTNNAQPYVDVYYLWEMALREQDQERYYSFDYGNVHFVSLDSNGEILLPAALDTNNKAPDDMLDWLKADLAQSEQPWKIAFFHHAPYSSSERAPNVLVRNSLLPVLEQGGVDIVLSGHDHHYERTQPIRSGEPRLHEEGGVYYFVVGSGGTETRPASGDWWTETVDDQDYAFLELTIDGCNAHGRAVGVQGVILDEFDLEGC